MPDRLNLGSGRDYRPGWTNLDVTSDTKPDVVHDLDQLPWPFADGEFRRVEARDVIEHLENPLEVMAELHRICEDGATVEIAVPHFSSPNAYTDLTHRHFFGIQSFEYVTGEHMHSYYTRVRFECVYRRIHFALDRPLDRAVEWIVNRSPLIYERRWAWMYPALFLRFVLVVRKPDRPAESVAR
jgi:SAM-dependent methyltransferase